MSKLVRALGLMSGTSMDGIDIALIETDGAAQVHRGPSASLPYRPEFRCQLVAAATEARGLEDRRARPGCLAAVERALTEQHAAVVERFLQDYRLAKDDISVLGFHGQTVLHRPQLRLTVQIGDGALLAAATGIDVVYDLRAADCAAGGQGAPLAPVYHRALVTRLPERPAAVLNIGGVANVTWIGHHGALLACDTGPGNALIDDWMMKQTGTPCDEDGRAALAGRVHHDVVRFYLSHSFFAAPAPKSLERNAFALDAVGHLAVEDGAATLAAFTAAAAAKTRELMPEEPQLWIVTGGGRKNRAIMTMLAERVHHAVVPAEAVGLHGDSLEAEAWAYLAVRSIRGLPISFPGTTGAPRPLTGGVLARPVPGPTAPDP